MVPVMASVQLCLQRLCIFLGNYMQVLLTSQFNCLWLNQLTKYPHKKWVTPNEVCLLHNKLTIISVTHAWGQVEISKSGELWALLQKLWYFVHHIQEQFSLKIIIQKETFGILWAFCYLGVPSFSFSG